MHSRTTTVYSNMKTNEHSCQKQNTTVILPQTAQTTRA